MGKKAKAKARMKRERKRVNKAIAQVHNLVVLIRRRFLDKASHEPGRADRCPCGVPWTDCPRRAELQGKVRWM
jgi:hypothetical protein